MGHTRSNIDFSDSGTYPEELEKIITDSFGALPTHYERDIRQHDIQYASDVGAAIEKYYRPYLQEQLYSDCSSVLKDCHMIAFHATRVLNPQLIHHFGIGPVDWDAYQRLLIDALNKLSLSKNQIDEAVALVKHEYQRKIGTQNISPLCFFSQFCQLDGGETAGYDQFCQTVGGELARWALTGKKPDVLQSLNKIGTPVVVKFSVPFADLPRYNVECIIYKFIQYYAARYFWNYDYSILFDSHTSASINPTQIISVDPYTAKLDYD